MSTLGHHSQLLSRSNKSFNNQLPRRSNSIPQSPYHTFHQRLQLRRLSLQPQHLNCRRRSLSLLRRRGHLHQLAVSATDSRPFQKKMSRLRHTGHDSQSFHPPPLPLPTRQTNLTPPLTRQPNICREDQKVKIFHQLLTVCPLSRCKSSKMQKRDTA